MTAVDIVRKEVLRDLWGNKEFEENWDRVYCPFLKNQIKDPKKPHRDEIVNLGDYLSQSFQSMPSVNRDNASLSSGGKAWERVVVWYLNLCLQGTNAIAIKPTKKFVPSKIAKALTITYNNVQVRSEPDLLILYNPLLSRVKTTEPKETIYEVLDIFNEYIGQSYVLNLQCKTTWNDSAQVPMLWGLVYSPKFSHEYVSIGIDGFNPSSLGGLRYGFMTLPSQKNLDDFKPTSVNVARVQTLSGGNYWGRPSKSGVVSSVKQIFNKSSPDFIPSVPAVGSKYSDAVRGGDTEATKAFRFL